MRKILQCDYLFLPQNETCCRSFRFLQMVLYAVFNDLTFIYHALIYFYSLLSSMSVFVCVSNAITSKGVRKIMTIYVWLNTEFSGGVECKKKKPPDWFWFKKWVLLPKKPFPYLTKVWKRGEDKRKTQRRTARCVVGHRKWIAAWSVDSGDSFTDSGEHSFVLEDF